MLGRTVTAAESLLVERFFEIDSEGVRAAVAAPMPCLPCGRCRLGFSSHGSSGVGGSVVDVEITRDLLPFC